MKWTLMYLITIPRNCYIFMSHFPRRDALGSCILETILKVFKKQRKNVLFSIFFSTCISISWHLVYIRGSLRPANLIRKDSGTCVFL